TQPRSPAELRSRWRQYYHGLIVTLPLPPIRSVYGVDFSGAKLAGRNTWIARLTNPVRGPARLVELQRLQTPARTPDPPPPPAPPLPLGPRAGRPAWALAFPFGLP